MHILKVAGVHNSSVALHVKRSRKDSALTEANEVRRAAIKEYAASHDLKIVREFRQEGVSGTVEKMDRAAWAEMLAVLHSNGVRTIVVEKLDRVARDLMIQEAAIAEVQKNGLTLVSVAEPDLMANDSTGVLMRQLMGAVAQYDKSQILAKLRGARMRKRAEAGRCEPTIRLTTTPCQGLPVRVAMPSAFNAAAIRSKPIPADLSALIRSVATFSPS